VIRLLSDADYNLLINYIKKETIINYFIINSLERSKYEGMFEEKWGEFDKNGNLIAVLLKRKTGNMQFYSRSKYSVEEFYHILYTEGFKKLIGEASILKQFTKFCKFSRVESGSFISKLDNLTKISKEITLSEVKKLEVENIDSIVELYSEIFSGFATKQSMTDKLKNGTGRGYYIEKNGKIVSIAQSAYEEKESAIIVGVATDFDYRKEGFAMKCLTILCLELILEGKTLYLQYDNPQAGKLYKKLGFEHTGQMINCYP